MVNHQVQLLLGEPLPPIVLKKAMGRRNTARTWERREFLKRR